MFTQILKSRGVTRSWLIIQQQLLVLNSLVKYPSRPRRLSWCNYLHWISHESLGCFNSNKHGRYLHGNLEIYKPFYQLESILAAKWQSNAPFLPQAAATLRNYLLTHPVISVNNILQTAGGRIYLWRNELFQTTTNPPTPTLSVKNNDLRCHKG